MVREKSIEMCPNSSFRGGGAPLVPPSAKGGSALIVSFLGSVINFAQEKDFIDTIPTSLFVDRRCLYKNLINAHLDLSKLNMLAPRQPNRFITTPRRVN